MSGTVKLFIGPMFCGKTESMINILERQVIANRHLSKKKECVIVKYANDTRYDSKSTNGIVTNSGVERNIVKVVKAKNLKDLDLSEYDLIGIDELQFYPDGPEEIQRLVNLGKEIVGSGLDADYLNRPFLRMPEIIANAEDVIKLKAVCMQCGGSASFTKRIGNSDQIEDIGGAEKYLAVCRSCHHK